MKYKFGIIGFGTMGQAFLTCILQKGIFSQEEIAVFDTDETKTQSYKNKFTVYSTGKELVENTEIVLISVKPQQFSEVAKETTFSPKNTIISIMAGTSIDAIRSVSGFQGGIARVMPNTPCKLGKGVCAVYFDKVEGERAETVKKILQATGEVVEIEEKYFDAVTSVSGSGPAYVYMFAKAMIEGGMEGGLSFEQSKKLTVNTLIGTAEMIRSSEEDLSVLIEKVCSKGGTTIEAVNLYREKGLETIIREGIESCRNRSIALGKKI